MKLIRFGEAGKEKPGVIIDEKKYRRIIIYKRF